MDAAARLSLADAVARLTALVAPVGAETVGVAQALGRVLAAPVTATFDQPPFAASSMDGWAVRAADLAGAAPENPVDLISIGEIPAGRPLHGVVGAGQTARIFTGGAIPPGADAVAMQEDVTATAVGGRFTLSVASGRHIRPAGADFIAGRELLAAGTRLTAGALGLAAASGRPWLEALRRPRVGIIAAGDEIALPGDATGPGRFVSSNAFALAGLVQNWGGEASLLGVVADQAAALGEKLASAAGCDLVVVIGGAGGGTYDVMARRGDGGAGWENWRLALRPCRAVTVGTAGGTPVLGLPGNPAPAFVGAILLLEPMVRRLCGVVGAGPRRLSVRVEAPMGPAGDAASAHFARLSRRGGVMTAELLAGKGGGGLLGPAAADALILRPPGAPAAPSGALAEALLIDA